MTSYFIGLDAGSSLCKAAVFDLDGRQLSEARRRTPLSRPQPGWVEADPDQCWTAVCEVLREAVEASGVAADQIKGLGLSAAMVGAWVVDGDGRALRPGINWEDNRSQSILTEMSRDEPELMSRIYRSSGSVLQQGCTLPVLAWLDRNEPDLLDRARHVFGYKDYLRMRLTGDAATDRTEASVAPGDAAARGRSDEMIALFGLTGRRGLLPHVAESESLAAGLTAQAAAETGLPEGLPVAIGAGDVPAMVIGAGGMRTGEVTAVLGTTCMLGTCVDRPLFAPADIGLLFSLPEGRWFRAMVNVAGTLNLDWAISILASDLAGDPARFDVVTELAWKSPVGANGVVYLPYLSESGIIAPVVSTEARAQFANLSPGHTRADMFRAVFEGVAYAMRDLLDMLPIKAKSLRLTGGGSQSGFWAQMIADVLQVEVRVPQGSEFGARGAALLAATATGHFANVRAASAAVDQIAATYEPRELGQRQYQQGYRRYCAARDQLLGRSAPNRAGP
ncbi:xylulokinase [Paracoccus xiamenensis]|uniref:xylulokinase n=1 Tax=Paracoccus xiamenensis TaxID=2714901 RepID=UPI00140C1164|nr:FGGY-family carbohydrate kinase [Paracoccus xiamenensis]NHF74465.1 carbohydrate kinase [Paracoccus xiamenensis]